jgi:hypothetical protein
MPVWAPNDHATLPDHATNDACSRDQLDLDGVMLDELECPFKHETVQRLVGTR